MKSGILIYESNKVENQVYAKGNYDTWYDLIVELFKRVDKEMDEDDGYVMRQFIKLDDTEDKIPEEGSPAEKLKEYGLRSKL